MTICAVLLSYKRPQNMRRIIDEIRKVESIDSIILSNNNPDICIEEWLRDGVQGVEIINQTTPTLYTVRFEIAFNTDHQYFFCPDDDIFLNKAQIEHLISELIANPTVPHGVWGQIKAYRDGEIWLGPDVKGVNCEVDVLNRAYFFTKSHLERVMRLSKMLGHKDINDAIFMEDVLLSFSGPTRPICHDIGIIDDCLTSNSVGIATHTKPGFAETRLSGYLKLVQITERV